MYNNDLVHFLMDAFDQPCALWHQDGSFLLLNDHARRLIGWQGQGSPARAMYRWLRKNVQQPRYFLANLIRHGFGQIRTEGGCCYSVHLHRHVYGDLILIRAVPVEQDRGRLERFLEHFLHDLSIPIQNIMMISDRILSTTDFKDAQARLLAKNLQTSCESLAYHFDQFRELSRDSYLQPHDSPVILTAPRPERVMLPLLMREMANCLRNSCLAKGLDSQVVARCPLPSSMFFDKSRLCMAMQNIIDNATKYTHSGYVDIELQTHGEMFEILVKDSGPGIPESLIPRLFRPGIRGDTDMPGKGIGLFNTKVCIESLGGTISLESVVGEGTIVRVRIPVLESPVSERERPLETLQEEPHAVKAFFVSNAALANAYNIQLLGHDMEPVRGKNSTNVMVARADMLELFLMSSRLDPGFLSSLDALFLIGSMSVPLCGLLNRRVPLVAHGFQEDGYLWRLVKTYHGSCTCDGELDGTCSAARILIVEDDLVSRQIMQEFLESEKYSVATASNGAAALRMLEQESFDLVILDSMLPDMEGIVLGECIFSRWPRTRLLVVSGTRSVRIREWTDNRPASLLYKPFSPSVLRSRIHEVLLEGFDSGMVSNRNIV